MGVVVTRVMHLLRDHQLIAVKRDGVKYIPARFLSDDGQLVKFVPGVIALLSDGGFTDDEILRYLFTEDDSCPEGQLTPSMAIWPVK